MIAEPTGTDGHRCLCRQFYTSSNYPPLPFIGSSRLSFHKKFKRLLPLRYRAGQGQKIFPMAFQRMNGNVSLHELRTTSPIAQ